MNIFPWQEACWELPRLPPSGGGILELLHRHPGLFVHMWPGEAAELSCLTQKHGPVTSFLIISKLCFLTSTALFWLIQRVRASRSVQPESCHWLLLAAGNGQWWASVCEGCATVLLSMGFQRIDPETCNSSTTPEARCVLNSLFQKAVKHHGMSFTPNEVDC